MAEADAGRPGDQLGRLTTSPRVVLTRAMLLVQPETVLKWHRALMRRK
jgi:hypothetical protein